MTEKHTAKLWLCALAWVHLCTIILPVVRERSQSNLHVHVRALAYAYVCVCAFHLYSDLVYVCVCMCGGVFVCSVLHWAWSQLSLNQHWRQKVWLQSTIHIVSSSLLETLFWPTSLPFLTHSKAPHWPFTGPASLLSHQLLELLHPIESGTSLEPLDLRLIEGVVERDGLLAAIAVLHDCCHGLEEGMKEKTDYLSIICPLFHQRNSKRS